MTSPFLQPYLPQVQPAAALHLPCCPQSRQPINPRKCSRTSPTRPPHPPCPTPQQMTIPRRSSRISLHQPQRILLSFRPRSLKVSATTGKKEHALVRPPTRAPPATPLTAQAAMPSLPPSTPCSNLSHSSLNSSIPNSLLPQESSSQPPFHRPITVSSISPRGQSRRVSSPRDTVLPKMDTIQLQHTYI